MELDLFIPTFTFSRIVSAVHRQAVNHDKRIIQKLANCAINEHENMPTPGNTGQARLINQMMSKKYLTNIQYFLIELMLQNITDENLTKQPNKSFNDLLIIAVSNGHFPICNVSYFSNRNSSNGLPSICIKFDMHNMSRIYI